MTGRREGFSPKLEPEGQPDPPAPSFRGPGPAPSPKHHGKSAARPTWATSAVDRVVLIVLSAALVACVVFSQSLFGGLIALTDGILAGLIVVAASGAGMWIVVPLGLSNAPIRWHILLGSAAGMGGLSLLLLAFGLLGWLDQWIWIVLLGAFFGVGIARFALLLQRERSAPPPPHTITRWLWLLAMPFLAIALLAATMPPGMPWGQEAGGYDVLEYHLAVPKEYFQAGRIHFLPHNVYSNFPLNAEMLYLLAMVLKGDPYGGAHLAKLLNAWLAVLTVAAAWLAGREYGPQAGTAAGVLAAACPWLTYLSGVAFVENGMLMFGMMSLAALCRYVKQPQQRLRWALAAGMLAGWSCGFKYIAAPMFLLPIGLGVFATACLRRFGAGTSTRETRWVWPPMLVLVGAGLTVGPWLLRNALMTGDPVFPLGYRVFGAKAGVWNDQLDERWRRGHSPTPEEAAIPTRVEIFLKRVLLEPRIGLMVLLLAPLILFSPRRQTIDAVCALMIATQVLVWLTATHLYARFAVPLIVPVTVLAARAVLVSDYGPVRLGIVGLIVLGVGANLYRVGRLYYDHSHDAVGQRRDPHVAIEWLRWNNPVNENTPPDATVWLVGEARTFYVDRPCYYHVVFNDSPLASVIRRSEDPTDVIAWLRGRGVSHVYVDWAEVRRLGSTYGFPAELNEDKFLQLEEAGLKRVFEKRSPRGRWPFLQVFEVP